MGSEIGERIERALADDRAAILGDLSRSISDRVQVDTTAARDIGAAICAAVDAAMARIAIPVTVQHRQDAQPAPIVDTTPIVDGLSPLARAVADAARSMAAISLPAPTVDVAVDMGPMARALAGREDSAAAALATLSSAISAFAAATDAQASAISAIATVLQAPRRRRIRVSRDASGALKDLTVEEESL